MRKVKISPLDKLFSEYIRRLSGGYCQRCGKYYGWQRLQCCHFYSRRHLNTRYDEDNCAALDAGCHMYLDSHPLEKTEWWKARIGEDKLEELRIKANLTTKIDRDKIREELKIKIKELGG